VQAGLVIEDWEWEQARELRSELEHSVYPELASQEGWGEPEWERLQAFLEDQGQFSSFVVAEGVSTC
jgi:hypothetical protein